MQLEDLIHCCLTTDPKIIPGDYTVIFSNSKSGALNSGVLLFSNSDLDHRAAQNVEYRLVSILMLLLDIEAHLIENPNRLNFEVTLDEGFRATSHEAETQLIKALEERGVKNALANELVKGEQRLF